MERRCRALLPCRRRAAALPTPTPRCAAVAVPQFLLTLQKVLKCRNRYMMWRWSAACKMGLPPPQQQSRDVHAAGTARRRHLIKGLVAVLLLFGEVSCSRGQRQQGNGNHVWMQAKTRSRECNASPTLRLPSRPLDKRITHPPTHRATAGVSASVMGVRMGNSALLQRKASARVELLPERRRPIQLLCSSPAAPPSPTGGVPPLPLSLPLPLPCISPGGSGEGAAGLVGGAGEGKARQGGSRHLVRSTIRQDGRSAVPGPATASTPHTKGGRCAAAGPSHRRGFPRQSSSLHMQARQNW